MNTAFWLVDDGRVPGPDHSDAEMAAVVLVSAFDSFPDVRAAFRAVLDRGHNATVYDDEGWNVMASDDSAPLTYRMSPPMQAGQYVWSEAGFGVHQASP